MDEQRSTPTMARNGHAATEDPRVAFRDYVLHHAKRHGIKTNRLSDVRKWLVKEFGTGFESTARRIILAEVKPTANTVDLLAERFGERFEPGKDRAKLPAVKADHKAEQASSLVKLAPIAKHARREDLARLAEEAAADPADVKLVAMLLLMFRDA